MNFITSLRIHYRDIIHLGPAVLARKLYKQDARGYNSIRTRYGTFFVRRSDTDFVVLRQIFVEREYDLDKFAQGKAIRNAYEDAIKRGRTPLIIDAGANAGFAARFFTILYPQARILSIEPDPSNAALCRANTRNFPQIEVLEAAIGAHPGHVTMERKEGESYSVRSHLAAAGAPITTINNLLSRSPEYELLIVKVDIEGFEQNLFSGATEWIARAFALIIEPHDWMFPGAGTSQTLQQAMLGSDRELLISGENLIWVKRT